MYKTRTLLAVLIVPFLGTLAFAPISASAFEGRAERGGFEDRIGEGHGMRGMMNPSFSDRARHVRDRGFDSPRGEEVHAWKESVASAIHRNSWHDFASTTNGTPLGDETTRYVFDRLAEAGDKAEAGKYDDMHGIMKELKDAGYRFRQLMHDSAMKLFPHPVTQ